MVSFVENGENARHWVTLTHGTRKVTRHVAASHVEDVGHSGGLGIQVFFVQTPDLGVDY